MPPDWLDQVSIQDVLLAVAAFVLVGVVVVGVVKVMHPMMLKVIRVLDLILGRPAEQGIPAQPSIVERLDAQDDAIADIKAQVTPNHGSTLKLSEEVQQLRRELRTLAGRFDAHLKR